ncbi:MAG TPA: kelch repeat-containing protein, partial [Candidatus Dormibacteraeota bacterium]|nr:kelch repeat-containing protein [Candidatus Dormibacteraeota bacterium]
MALLPNAKVLIVGGFSGSSPTNAVYLWDISTNEFTGTLAGTNRVSGPLAHARAAHTATLLPNGKVLIAGGATNNYAAAISSVEIYDPSTGTVSGTGSMTTNRVEHTATLLANGKVLVIGGCTNGNPGTPTIASAELYNPATGLWAATGVMTTNRSHHTATLLPNGKVLVAGGARSYNSFSNALSSAEIYDPNTGTWRPTASMIGAHSSHGAILLPNGKVLVAGGIGSSNVVTSNAELYDPATETWTSTGPMTTARYWYNLLLLFNGKVLASSLGTSELYDPDTGVWTPTVLMATNRQFQTATLLPNGRVLVNGGRIGDGLNPFFFDVHSSSEIYDPVVGTWTPSGSLRVPRYLHTMTLLPNGQTLIVGGLATNFVDLSSTELFDTSLNFSNYWRPQITSATSPLTLGGNFSLNGSNFRGLSEGSGGNGCRDGASDFPVVQLRNLENGQSLFLNSSNWQTNTFISTPVWDFPPGHALATAFVNGIPSTGVVVNVSVPVATPPILNNPIHLGDGSFQFSFSNAVGALFGVWTATNLALPRSNWTALGAVPEVAPGQFQFHDTQHPTDPHRFYRVRAP